MGSESGCAAPQSGEEDQEMVSHRVTWAVLCDGIRGRIMAHDSGRADWRCLRVLPAAEAASAVPGPNHQPPGLGGAAKPNGARALERPIAIELAATLNRANAQRRFDQLALIAPTPTLGEIRARLDPLARSRLTAEVARDPLGISNQVIEEDLAQFAALSDVTPLRPCRDEPRAVRRPDRQVRRSARRHGSTAPGRQR